MLLFLHSLCKFVVRKNMKIMENKNLKSLNTFAIDCVAKEFVEFNSQEDFEKIDKNGIICNIEELKPMSKSLIFTSFPKMHIFTNLLYQANYTFSIVLFKNGKYFQSAFQGIQSFFALRCGFGCGLLWKDLACGQDPHGK